MSEGEYSSYLSDDDRIKIVTGIVERVTSRFDELARELVTAVSSIFFHDLISLNLIRIPIYDLDL